MCQVRGGGGQQNLVCEPQKDGNFGGSIVKKWTFFGGSDFRCQESSEISVKLGEGGDGSQFF